MNADPSVQLARVRAAGGSREERGEGHAVAGGLELDRNSCRVLLHGGELTLTATEFRLLEFLMSRPGVVFSREQLLNAVWGHDRAVTDRTVDVYVLRLRQKVEPDPANPTYVRSVRGFGYSFNENGGAVELPAPAAESRAV